ncbi:MAG TPA: uracil-DNA glycosylase [Vicinamibacterales bacterium]
MDPRQIAEHLRFYQELGVTGISRDQHWRGREGMPRETAEGVEAEAPPRTWTLAEIREEIGDCTRCKLHALGRKQIVFGVGNPNAELMFVGEGPGADEDIQGIPFVGRAGQLLTRMIEAMGFARDDVYIANVVKCRPPDNRNPEPDEIASCEPFLFRQIQSIKPKVIVALGSFAARTLLRTQDPISRLRGRVYEYHGAKLIPTFHPSFLLRSPAQKKYAWEDLKTALGVMGREVPK